MNVQIAAFAFGCLLLMVGILGGGFEVKELKVPKVGRASRLTSCAFSMLFVFLGFRPDFITRNAATAKPAVTPPPPTQIVVTVEDRTDPPPASVPTPEVRTPKTPPQLPTTASPKTGKGEPWEQKPRKWFNQAKDLVTRR